MSHIMERQTRQRWIFEKDSEILRELRSLCGHLTERLLSGQYKGKQALWDAYFPRIDALRGSLYFHQDLYMKLDRFVTSAALVLEDSSSDYHGNRVGEPERSKAKDGLRSASQQLFAAIQEALESRPRLFRQLWHRIHLWKRG